MDDVLDVAVRHGLAIVEDAAHAPGATWRSRMCGTFGDVGCFSFFSNKNLPVGEGGMVVTDDRELARRVSLLRSHGMTTLTWDRHRGHAHDYDVVAHGFNYRMDELRAAVGRIQLGRLVERNARRAQIAALYRDALHGVNGLTLPFPPIREAASAHHLAVVVLPADRSREEFRAALAARGVQTSVHYPPIHTFSSYRGLGSRRPLPVTDAVSGRLVTLPLYPSLTDDQVGSVVETVLGAV
jgi:dTDP-4-amino-4,6-dideoxygalactose transaminase